MQLTNYEFNVSVMQFSLSSHFLTEYVTYHVKSLKYSDTYITDCGLGVTDGVAPEVICETV